MRSLAAPITPILALLLAGLGASAQSEAEPWQAELSRAATAADTKQWDEAREAGAHGLELADEAGADASKLATALSRVAERYREHGRLMEARVLLEEALARLASPGGTPHAKSAGLLASLAALHADLEDRETARRLARQAQRLAKAQLIPDLPTVGRAQATLAHCAAVEGRTQEALRLYGKSYALLQDALGPDHSDVATVRANLAAVYLDLERSEEAIPLLESALRVYRARLDPADPRRGAVHQDLGYAYARAGEPDRAVVHLEAAVHSFESTEPKHPDLALALRQLATAHRSRGELPEAERCLLRALALLEARGDEEGCATTLHALGVVAYERRQDGRARAYFERCLAIWERHRRPDDARMRELRTLIASLPPDEALPPVGAGGSRSSPTAAQEHGGTEQ